MTDRKLLEDVRDAWQAFTGLSEIGDIDVNCYGEAAVLARKHLATTLSRVEAALAETAEEKVDLASDTKLLDGIMAWVPDGLHLESNGSTIFYRHEKDGAVQIELPEEPWFSRVKDTMMVVLLKARSIRSGSENS